MEHLQLLLRFMSYPESDANIISRAGGDTTLPIPNHPASAGFVPNFGGLSKRQNNHNSIEPNKRKPSRVLPIQSQPPLNQPSPEYALSRTKIFFGGHHKIREGFLSSPSDQGMREVVKNESKVKCESFDSTIFPSPEDGFTRFLHSPMDVDTINAQSQVFKSCSGSVGHNRKRIIVGKSAAIVLQPAAETRQTTVRESCKVPQNEGLSKMDFVQRVCITKIDKACKLYTCNTCKRNFKQKCHLYRHQRQHSGVKRFFCVHCNRGFYQRSNLLAHGRTHCNDSRISHQYACTFCTKRFTRNSSLMKHLTRHSKGLIKMK